MTQSQSNTIQALPIDIHYNKLLDWLVNRRHCTQQCQPFLTLIRGKMPNAINTSRHEGHTDTRIQELLAMEDLNYFRVKELFELLKGTDAGKTNLLGQYSVQSMKNWNEIVKLYEKDGTYLVEAAQAIARNVNFEVPAVKKQINKCQQTQKDCLRKEKESQASSEDIKRQYAADCKRYGIQGKKIKTEFAGLIKDLPSDLDTLALKVKDLNSSLEYFDAFSSFVIGSNFNPAKALPMLRHIVAKGNTTTFEWKTGAVPSKVEAVEISIDTSDENDAVQGDSGGAIDWGAGDDGGIDFGDDIDFDITDITVEGDGLESQGKKDRDSPDSVVDWCIVDQATLEVTDTVARGDNALPVLANPQTRNAFIDDLHELTAFLSQRASELSKLKGTENHLASAPSLVHLDGPSVSAMSDSVSAILERLTCEKMMHLLLIRDSPRYVDRLKDTLQQKLVRADKLALKGREMAVQRQEAVTEEAELTPQIDKYRQQTRFLKGKLQEEISKKYDGRKVNIVGEVNTI